MVFGLVAGADLRGDDDLRAEGGTPGAQGIGAAQRYRRHHRSGGGAAGAGTGLVGRRGDRRRLRLQHQQLFLEIKDGKGRGGVDGWMVMDFCSWWVGMIDAEGEE